MAKKGDSFFIEEQVEGVHFHLKIKQWLLRQKTRYQELIVAETEDLGRMMALDGKVMLTEADEAYYHEMLVHPLMVMLDNPQTVAVIGGGDGGSVREVLRHPSVKKVYWVEIDEAVVEASRSFLSSVCMGIFEDPRVDLIIAPGEEWLADKEDAFDALIVDGTDPIGPALPLFEQPFFEMCRRVLKAHGLFSMQCGTPFYFHNEVRMVNRNLGSVFPQVKLYLGYVPTYPSGLWAYAVAGERLNELNLSEIRKRCEQRGLTNLRYYSPEIHLSSFVLPPFVQELLEF
ncbi:MAG: polyamine aminopropyltransferase [Clostridia bacterium]|nr:polyamine aminopropyltransferase [Clostridia bacterium]